MSTMDAVLRANPGYVDALYRQYLEDPGSVESSWAAFFAGYELGTQSAAAAPAPAAPAAPAPEAEDGGVSSLLTEGGALPEGVRDAVTPALRIYDVVYTYRTHGHLIADIDPLGRRERQHPFFERGEFGFTDDDLDRVVRCESYRGMQQGTLAEFVEHLSETYTGPIGVEYMDVAEKPARDWLQERMEPIRNRPHLEREEEIEILRRLVEADTFEETLGRMYPGAKRFSLEGGTTLVTLLRTLVSEAAERGVEQLVMGMAHRGRLNVLAHVLGKPYEYILAEFEGRPLPPAISGYGDVKYHLGYSRDHALPDGRKVHLTLEFNPSHLETVHPVVEGIVRAKQNHLGDTRRERVVPVILHGDASFPAQGVVAETLTLSGVRAYTTGGTIHVIVNNQVGFTTSPEEGRSTRYASDLAKVVRAPVFHVNADHPEAVQLCARIALGYRQRFHADVVIDLVCYRRHGHNELDDPSFTQPVMQALIKAHAPASKRYAECLIRDEIVTPADVEAMVEGVRARMEAAREKAKTMATQYLDMLEGAWKGLKPAGADWSADTAVPRPTLERIARALVTVPEGFHWHPRLEKLMRERADMVLRDGPVDWGCGEALAIGSLLLEGTKVRLTGQDTVRGTFSHRHAVYTDQESGAQHVPLNHLGAAQNVLQVVNSPLSEEAVLGFEYGYSTADPWTLVAWEAQFGDFVNGAQVIVDQLIASCEYKWGRMSGIVLLLPHGYEGQGPEHSSARLERFLELCAENNMQVCNFTTPAQLFHALRRQVKRDFRKPLVLMTPKSLLRHPRAVSSVRDFTDGAFQPLIPDAEIPAGSVRKLLLCSGKIYFALLEAREKRGAEGVAIARIEQLYPFPDAEMEAMLAALPRLSRVAWVQEEPRNMGAWRNLRHCFERHVVEPLALEYVGRDSRAVPATGSFQTHQQEEAALVAAAFEDVPGERVVRRDPSARSRAGRK